MKTVIFNIFFMHSLVFRTNDIAVRTFKLPLKLGLLIFYFSEERNQNFQ